MTLFDSYVRRHVRCKKITQVCDFDTNVLLGFPEAGATSLGVCKVEGWENARVERDSCHTA